MMEVQKTQILLTLMTSRRTVVSTHTLSLIRTSKVINMSSKKGVEQVAKLEMVAHTKDKTLSVRRVLVLFKM